jgi:hypothetical protein
VWRPTQVGLNTLVVAAETALLSIALLALSVATAESARPPTARESGGLHQALFDYFATRPADPEITKIRVATARPGRGSPFRTLARVDLRERRAGVATALLGYVKAKPPGWRVLTVGSSEVGCRLTERIFGGRKRFVLVDLRLTCR